MCIGLPRSQSEHDDILPWPYFKLAFLFVDLSYRKAKFMLALKFTFIIEPLKYGTYG